MSPSALSAFLRAVVLTTALLLGAVLMPHAASAKGAGTSTPTLAEGLSGVVDLDAWYAQSCAVTSTGSAYCWGNVGSETADNGGAAVIRSAPTLVAGITDAVKTSGRCVVKTDGTVWCWGPTWMSGAPDPVDAPTQAIGLTGATDIDVDGVTCALKSDGTVWCWGDKRFGATGTSGSIFTGQNEPNPAQVPGVTGATSIAVGEQHACAVRGSGELWCWGTGPKLGGNAPPQEIGGFSGVAQAAASVASTCLVTGLGAAHCYGDNAWGEMGVRPDGLATGAAPIQSLPAMTQIATADAHTCAVTSTGDGRCWGLEEDGRLGNPVYRGDGTSESPVPVLGLAAIRAFVVGSSHTCALLLDGTVRCFGSDANGQLGNGEAPLPADPSPDTPGATIPAASSIPLATPTPKPTLAPQAATTPKAKPVPSLARTRTVVTLNGAVLTLRAGKTCPARVTVTIRRKRTKAPTVRKRLPATKRADGTCVVSGSVRLSTRLAARKDLAIAITSPAIKTLTRAVPAS